MTHKIFSNKEAIKFGWETTQRHLWFLVGLFLLIFILSVGTGNIPGLSIVINLFAGISILTAALDIYAGHKVKFNGLFKKYNVILEYLVATVFYAIMVIIGLVLFIIPGVYLALRYQFFRFLIVDKEMDPLEALRESGRMTEGHMWQLLGLFCLCVLINIVGLLVFGVGLLVTVPTTYLAYTFAYKKLLAKEHHSA